MANKIINIFADKSDIVNYTIAPVIFNKKQLLERGYSVHVHNRISDKLLECNILCLVSKPLIRKLCDKSITFDENSPTVRFLKNIRDKVEKIIWLDDSDSTGVTHFEILPYIDRYLKKQLFKDYSKYRKNYYGGRIFTDFYHKKFNINDSNLFKQYYPLKKEMEYKVDLSWNIGLGNVYNSFSFISNIINYFPVKKNINYKVNFNYPDSERDIDLFLKTSTNLSRETVAFHRKELVSRLQSYLNNKNYSGLVCDKKYNLEEYSEILNNKKSKISSSLMKEMMSKSKIMPSPFGWGEIGARDYEAFIYGAVLLKPDMSHMRTWPEVFTPYKTYMPFKWDFTDLYEKMENLLANDETRINISKNGQDIYKSSISKEGMIRFCDWFESQICR